MPFPALPPSWAGALSGRVDATTWRALEAFVDEERGRGPVFPPEPKLFTALALTAYDDVEVVLLGQDPYHGPGQAHGLAMSVEPGVALPPSLANIFKELAADVGGARPDNGCLAPWARRGVLLLNAALTVRDGTPGSHAKPWEAVTDAIIGAVDARARPAVFLLWGAHARKKARLLDRDRHRVIEGAHPSPLSANAGFFGSKPFTAVNAALTELGRPPIDWRIPDLGVPMAKRVRRGT